MDSRTEYKEEQLELGIGVSCDVLGTGEVGEEEEDRRRRKGR